MNTYGETIIAKATAEGVGALAVIRLSGDKSIATVNKLFSRDIENAEGYSIHFGTLKDEVGIIDEVLVSIFRAPKSFTGEESVEISCHGSAYIANRIIQACINLGVRTAGKGEFTKRAFLNGKMDLSQAEAVADMIVTDSQASHKIALDQMRGGYSSKMKELRTSLLDFASLIELELDFGEEDVEFADRSQLITLINEIQKEVSKLVESFKMGNAIKEGVPIAIIGRPNAGKSTLLNAILKENRAIVSEEAGTTRDTIEEVVVLQGTKFRFIDTAGIRETSSKIEAEGIKRALETANKAELILYLFDPIQTSVMDVMEDILEFGQEKIRVICNKSDLLNLDIKHEMKQSGMDLLFVSSKKEEIEPVLNSLKSYTEQEIENSITLANARHYEALQNAHSALDEVKEGMTNMLSGEMLAFHINDALEYLGEITGQVTNDELLGNIFGNFCIGK